MTDTELFEIVKGHREAWPEGVTHSERAIWGEWKWVDESSGGFSTPKAVIMFEASFHRALLKRGDVYTTALDESATVHVRDMDFTASSLIGAYAKALEWLK